MNPAYENTNDKKNIAILFACVLGVYFIIWSFTGQDILQTNAYNSFSLQADAWLNGRTDLGMDYPHLELAIFNDKYFVSFPPFPSVVMLPFVFIFGTNTPDNIINLAFMLISVLFSYKIAKNFNLPDEAAIITALFFTLCSNMVFLMFRGWVWFLAQSMSFAFCTVSCYFATTKKPSDSTLSFLFLAFAIGCRPFQAIFAFITLYLVVLRYRMQDPDMKPDAFFSAIIAKLLLQAVPALMIGFFYAALNFARFGNIFEFGHNYLPEFTSSSHGQFSFFYLKENLSTLIRIPNTFDKGLDYPFFTGFSVFMVNPLMTIALPFAIFKLIKKTEIKYYKPFILLCLTSVLVFLFLICMHKTMGGWQFGNRYTVDCLPYVFILYLSLTDYDSKIYSRYCIPFIIFGLVINSIGTAIAYRI